MDTAQHIRLLQLTYAAQLADATRHYGLAGILDRVTAERRAQRLAAGATQAAQLGVKDAPGAFTVSADLFGCADWAVAPEEADGAFEATAGRCLLCAMVKKAGGASPCRLFCLDPMEGMVKGVAPGTEFEVLDTLFEGARCRVRVSR
jgi:hypothetical protein